MKREYITPVMECEEFVTSEYVAACYYVTPRFESYKARVIKVEGIPAQEASSACEAELSGLDDPFYLSGSDWWLYLRTVGVKDSRASLNFNDSNLWRTSKVHYAHSTSIKHEVLQLSGQPQLRGNQS